MKIAVFSLCARSLNDNTIYTLPFGKGEQERLLSIGNSSRATESLGALLALRELMGNASFPIRRTAEGKPYFDAPHAPPFSLSHTENVAVAALADPCEGNIGIDIEELRPYAKKSLIANRFFTAKEQATLAQSPTDEAFFKLWTAKEATAKMYGRALSSHLAGNEPSSPNMRHFRLQSDNRTAILCVTAEQPIETIEWLSPPTITIQEI